MKLYKSIAIILILTFTIIFCGCNKQDDKFTISGTVDIDNNPGIVTAAVKIYQTVDFPADLKQYSVEFPQIGAELSQDWFFDHRWFNPVKTGNCSASGAFEIDDIDEGYYIAAFFAEGYGWIYSAEFHLNDNLNLGQFDLFPETNVDALIEQDQVWESGRHYLVDTPVTVFPNVKLTIEPGVWIRFVDSSSKLTVLGEIAAEGTSDAIIRFTTAESIGEPVNWSKIMLSEDSDTASVFRNVLIEFASNGISLGNGKTSMQESIVRSCINGISVLTNSPAEIDRCLIYDCYTGIDVASHIDLSESVIYNCSSTGITISNFTGMISNNLIANCGIGISEDYVDILHIDHCQIQENLIGIDYAAGAEGNMTLSFSNIVDNSDKGIFCKIDAYPIISECNIDNDTYNIFLEGQVSGGDYLQSGNISALNCYWGTTDVEEIHSKIYDGFTAGSHPLLGEVVFLPFELDTVAGAGPQ